MDTTQTEAISHAQYAADKYCLPQTIFRNEDTRGWWHTNPFASVLGSADVYMTVLPERFFI